MAPRGDRRTFKNEDLVLKVSTNVDPGTWDENRYEPFLDALCGSREYQKTAILSALRFLLGGNYANLRELARANYDDSDPLQQRYGSFAGLEKQLQFPDQLACSIDLATGTGKSYVLYGLGAILLVEGIVDRVLVLCPSNTIESGLLGKFKELATNSELRDALPDGAVFRTPRVIDASESITGGCICVENYHAILSHVKSSIRDSLKGVGARTAVLCDEAHHVANESKDKIGKWKEFLLDPEFGFKLVVGVSGTCYVGDEYFADVVCRYSIRQAIEERFVKNIDYVAEAPDTSGAEEKWQLIFNRHAAWKKKLKARGIRPLTIVVTKAIADCKRVAEELRAFLSEWEKIPEDQAAKKVLAVTSAREHQTNLMLLDTVDSTASQVEWIVSVSMLSEGWDVKNVFQIVPHEERAFNSKLLIAQVLGRGLRVPEGWKGEQPVVTVFNHDAWSGRIRHLVNEVLEIERRISAAVIAPSSHHFDLFDLDYSRIPDTSSYTKTGEYKLLESGYVELPTQVETEEVVVEFERALTHEHANFRTKIVHKTYSIEDVAELIFQRLKSNDDEAKDTDEPTAYAKKFPIERCRAIVEESLKRAKIKSGRVTEDNRQRFLAALGTLKRKQAKRVVYKLTPNVLVQKTTRERQGDSCSAAELRRGDRTVFFGPHTEKLIVDVQQELFRELLDEDGDLRAGREEIKSAADFKTPLSLVIAEAQPERKFVRQLFAHENAMALDAWIKNTAQKFYWIEYTWRKGEHNKRGEFSPDFFIKKGDWIFVVEVKGDEEIKEPSTENRRKYEFAAKHFATLNGWLTKAEKPQRYQMTFLTPSDFNKFFQKMRDNDLVGFRSELDVVLAGAERDATGPTSAQ